MAEDKKSGPAPGKDLTSKIATAFRSMPPEQRGQAAEDANEVQNPDLDQAFDKMVEMYKVKRPERENSVVTFPAPPTMRLPRRETEPGPAFECPECGHHNPTGNQFCGMCGAAREDAAPPPPRDAAGDEPGLAAAEEAGVKHHHHYYHHHHYRNNPYLLLAVVLLLGVIAWQQWQDYRQATSPVVSAPAVKAQPQPPVQAQPNPGPKPAAPAPAVNGKPAKKPVSQSSPVQAPVQPVPRGEPPGAQAKAPETAPPVTAPPVHDLARPSIPVLPSFAGSPAHAAPAPAERLVVSQGVSAGRLIKKVAPVYPPNSQRLEGQVVLETVIAKDGSVKSVKVLSGNPVLAEAAVQAVRQWRYQPYLLNGQAVEIDTRVQVNFKR